MYLLKQLFYFYKYQTMITMTRLTIDYLILQSGTVIYAIQNLIKLIYN